MALRGGKSTGRVGPRDLQNAMNSLHVGRRYFVGDGKDLARVGVEGLPEGTVGRELHTGVVRWIGADGSERTAHFVEACRSWP